MRLKSSLIVNLVVLLHVTWMMMNQLLFNNNMFFHNDMLDMISLHSASADAATTNQSNDKQDDYQHNYRVALWSLWIN
jgi:hypothetical protein